MSCCTGTLREKPLYCLSLITSLCLAIVYCWVFCIGFCVPIHEDRTPILLYFVARLPWLWRISPQKYQQWLEDWKYGTYSHLHVQIGISVNSFETHLRTIQSNWITSAISYPAIPSPVHTQRRPVTCNADVFQGTFATRNEFIALYHLLVRHDGFVWSLTKNRWSIAVVSLPIV